ncbi:class I SAM-dependent methyltransferase [Desulfobulbus rhabdoformis]|uniref:class I SAM-dependent DNA methyltransferase n=1 Tax=Desulfobulbus rhabdoformis TaxID=34032 RepID=UPI0019655E0B|nr:class I SAM-dependent methyltransferase [Desulfobulbus rhabdoformis]MBM9614860.1 class I SAM-dependent methyltransferase [Desulfobulbus rhabdoformis]
MISENKTLDKVYTAKDHDELMDAYGEWANEYEKDTVDRFGYVAHIESADAFEQVMSHKGAYILDAGCGTGLVGKELSQRGYQKVDALDCSEQMLGEARDKKVYHELFQADMSKRLEFEDNRYDAVICTGTFTYGHVQADAFEELVRITKPGGIICFTIREGAFDDCGYQEKMAEMEHGQSWEQVALVDATYFVKEKVSCKICTYRVTA